MIDRATIKVLQSLAAALSTLHQAHRRGATIRIEGRAGESWTLTVDAVTIGGRLWSAGSASLTQLIVAAHGHILADVADWAAPDRVVEREDARRAETDRARTRRARMRQRSAVMS